VTTFISELTLNGVTGNSDSDPDGGLAFDSAGNIYVGENENTVGGEGILRFDSDGMNGVVLVTEDAILTAIGGGALDVALTGFAFAPGSATSGAVPEPSSLTLMTCLLTFALGARVIRKRRLAKQMRVTLHDVVHLRLRSVD